MPFRDVDYSQGGEMAILSYNVVFKKNLHICTSSVTNCILTLSLSCRCCAVNANSAFRKRASAHRLYNANDIRQNYV